MDMSLDDVIKANRQTRGRGYRGRARGVRGVGGPKRGFSRGRVFYSPRGGVQKKRPYTAYQKPRQVPAAWAAELGYSSQVARGRGFSTGPRTGGIGKLLICNLDFGVNDDDIQELFSEFGPLRKAAVHYDKVGRSLGTAEVVFERKMDATKAVQQYNGVPLDGRPMNIQLVGHLAVAQSGTGFLEFGNTIPTIVRGSVGGRRGRGGSFARGSTYAAAAASTTYNSTSTRGFRGGTFGSRARGGIRGRGRGRGRGGRTVPPTAEQLDAELDAYRTKMDTE